MKMVRTLLNEGGKPPTAKAGSRRKLAVLSALSEISVEPSRLLSGRIFGTFVSGQKYERKSAPQSLNSPFNC